MENSVKALFIASGILVTLIAISLVINIFMEGKLIIDGGATNIELSTISHHNSQFISYEKDNLTYANLQSLFGIIVDNNKRQTDNNLKVSIELERYQDKGSGIYKATGAFDTLQFPTDNSFMSNKRYVYLDSKSVYKGKIFKATLKYNDMGIIDRIRIEKIY